MNNCSNKNPKNGFSKMKPDTRAFFQRNFYYSQNQLDSDKAAAFFGVSVRTIQNWWRTGCPNWVDKFVEVHQRAIPDTKAWDGFRFGHDGRLYTPYKGLHFGAGDLLNIFDKRSQWAWTRRDNEKLHELLNTMRSDEEVHAIREEIDYLVKSLGKIRHSPVLAERTGFSQKVTVANKPRRQIT